jgi:MoaA/NifB/PqqE/SkfB family radical SAM enzyme
MKPSPKLAIDVTWKCNWSCGHCFYRRNAHWHKQIDMPLPAVKDRINRGQRGGLTHVVMIGQGEPSLCPNTPAILDYARSLGLSTSIITNGTTGLHRFQSYYRTHGLDHLHISSHGLNGTLDRISGVTGAFAKQAELKQWLQAEGLPYRTNTTLQQQNYTELLDLVDFEIAHGVKHFAFLGFLPHYEWRQAENTLQVAVHPAVLRSYIEEASLRLRAAGVWFTIRYQPFCHLRPDLWPHVVNAHLATYCPWEWSYTIDHYEQPALGELMVPDKVKETARRMGESVGIQGAPCNECSARRHCGGWNRFYAAAFDGAGLSPIREVPPEYAAVWDRDGGVFDLNPANQQSGTLRT